MKKNARGLDEKKRFLSDLVRSVTGMRVIPLPLTDWTDPTDRTDKIRKKGIFVKNIGGIPGKRNLLTYAS